ncbi:protein O-linked-mannose beta-1,2-N-acetylglucosaminyltransferase 1-like [Procambarus clarkii]|uniref:protein O-linked-mannose beta-1,2-N-acetylglucosaminyltransferase 1-like n=1 Tax=Procambarus clarkii TaxID=6728 RepID=UPI0037439D86
MPQLDIRAHAHLQEDRQHAHLLEQTFTQSEGSQLVFSLAQEDDGPMDLTSARSAPAGVTVTTPDTSVDDGTRPHVGVKTAGEKLEESEESGEAEGETLQSGIDIDVSVSKWKLLIMVNGKQVAVETMVESEVRMMRKGGVYLTVLHPATASLLHYSRHRTFEDSADQELRRVLEGVQPGRIVVVAAMHDGFAGLSEAVVHLLAHLGSKVVTDGTVGDRWAWVWTKGGRTWAEGAVFSTRNPRFVYQGGPLHLHAHLPTAPFTGSGCEGVWPRGGTWAARRRFCHSYEGYGDLCSCHHPRPLPPTPTQVRAAGVGVIPTVVVASVRPLLLDRCLRRLMSVAGSDPGLTLVVADGHPDGGLREVAALVNLYGMKFMGHDAGGRDVTLRITRHYKVTMDAAFTTFPWADKVIILEEDLYVALDFYSYFAQTAPLMDRDPSLYCVSAWNDMSQAGAGGDPTLVLRVDTMAGLGWLLSRRVYEDVMPNWPPYDKLADWDMWLRLPENQKGRECLVPEVSRTFHFGVTGAHLTAYFQSNYYAHTALNTAPDVTLRDLHRLEPAAYDLQLTELLAGGRHLDGGATNPCSTQLLPRNSSTHHVLWIKMNEIADDYTYKGVMSCLLLWDLDVRAHHKLLWRLRWRGTPLLVVGWPASPFSSMKPKEVQVLIRYDPGGAGVDPPVYQYLPSSTTTSH